MSGSRGHPFQSIGNAVGSSGLGFSVRVLSKNLVGMKEKRPESAELYDIKVQARWSSQIDKVLNTVEDVVLPGGGRRYGEVVVLLTEEKRPG